MYRKVATVSKKGVVKAYAAADGANLIKRIESRNGLHTLEYAQEIGLGNCSYEIKSVDN